MLLWLKKFYKNWKKPTDVRHQAGRRAERLAEKYLHKQGLRILARNFLCKNGELDLVMRDNEFLVFVEVRYRAQGGALESINSTKQRRVMACAVRYLQVQHLSERQARRFDIVTVQGDWQNPSIDWIQDAFRH